MRKIEWIFLSEIRCGSTKQNGRRESSCQTRTRSPICEAYPADTDNPFTPPENPEKKLDDWALGLGVWSLRSGRENQKTEAYPTHLFSPLMCANIRLSSHAWNKKMKPPHKRTLANISGVHLCWENGVAGAVERSGHSRPDPDAAINPLQPPGFPIRFRTIWPCLLGDRALRF